MIRPYKNSDYEMIASWWKYHNEVGPLPGMMIENGTFIYEHEGQPILSLTVFITQSNVCYLEGYIACPGISKNITHPAGKELWDYCYDWAHQNKMQYVVCYTDKRILSNRYEQLGMTKALDNLISLTKDLGV